MTTGCTDGFGGAAFLNNLELRDVSADQWRRRFHRGHGEVEEERLAIPHREAKGRKLESGLHAVVGHDARPDFLPE